jgi:Zn finger protein HypA/HybF involved in hydrogenase expression
MPIDIDNDEYVPPVLVRCARCQDWIREEKVEFLNVESDMFERDVLTFNCPDCKTRQRSLRRS